MKRLRLLLPALLVAGGGLFLGRHARAADHIDGPQATGEPTADIADLFTWMSSDDSKVNLVMTVNSTANANHTALFSDAVKYVFHTESQAAFGATTTSAKDIICTFTGTTAPQTIKCWVGTDEYVTGDPSNTAGITSSDNKVRVFAGARNDPFFFNLAGFKAAVSTVDSVEPLLGVDGGIPVDAAGCPNIGPSNSAALVAQLSHNPDDGGAAIDTFADQNVLAIVMQVDKSLLTSGGKIVSVWASTNN